MNGKVLGRQQLAVPTTLPVLFCCLYACLGGRVFLKQNALQFQFLFVNDSLVSHKTHSIERAGQLVLLYPVTVLLKTSL